MGSRRQNVTADQCSFHHVGMYRGRISPMQFMDLTDSLVCGGQKRTRAASEVGDSQAFDLFGVRPVAVGK